jgi:hypothetical protein
VLRLEAVTYGDQHRFVKGRYWQRLLAPLLSPALQQLSGATVYTYRIVSPRNVRPLVFWFWLSPNSSPRTIMRPVAPDEHGSELANTAFPMALPPATSDNVQCCALLAFPRRGARVRLRFTGSGGAREDPEFTISNPTPGPHPVWTAAPLPISKRDGERVFTLTGFTTGHAAPAEAPAVQRDKPWTRCTFQVTAHGRPGRQWEPVGVTLSDATGNTIWPRMAAGDAVQSQAGGAAQYAFPAGLLADESAWKLRAEFVPTAGFTPSDLWTVRNLALSTRTNETPTTQVVAERHGSRVRFRLQLSRGPDHSGRFWVNVRLASLPSGLRVGLVRVTGSDGGPLRQRLLGANPRSIFLPGGDFFEDSLSIVHPTGTSAIISQGAVERVYQLDAPREPQWLDLTFVVLKSRFVEFVVRPSRV